MSSFIICEDDLHLLVFIEGSSRLEQRKFLRFACRVMTVTEGRHTDYT